MPKIRVTYARIAREVGFIDVEASNADEAIDKADKLIDENEDRLTMCPEDYTVELQLQGTQGVDEDLEGEEE